MKCDCDDRIGIEINSISSFKKYKEFFESQVDKGIYEDISDYNRIWYKDGGTEKEIYRTTHKYYKCIVCHCIWEFIYPEIPASGRIKKDSN